MNWSTVVEAPILTVDERRIGNKFSFLVVLPNFLLFLPSSSKILFFSILVVMPASLDTVFTALGAAAAATSIASGIPIIRRSRALHKQSQHEGQIRLQETFSDKDGQATEASEAAYNVKIQKVLILLSSIVGVGCSTAFLTRVVVGTQYDFIIGSMLVAVSWVCQKFHSF